MYIILTYFLSFYPCRALLPVYHPPMTCVMQDVHHQYQKEGEVEKEEEEEEEEDFPVYN